MTRERLLQFDALKSFAIFLVIYGHCIQYLLSTNYTDEIIYLIVYSFHMPLFMMLSGFFAYSAMERPFLSSIYIKARQLLLPLCTVCLLASTIHFLNFTAEDNFIKSFFNKFCTSLWFLKTAFSCFVFSKIVFWFIKLHFISNNKCLKLFILIISIIITQIIPFLNTNIKYFTVNIGTMYLAFIIGLFIKKHWDTLMETSIPVST